MIQELPPIIQQVGFDFPFDFENDPKKIWLIELPVFKIPIGRLTWHLETPFWSSENGYYDLSPKQLLESPELSPYHYQKTITANLDYPIDYVFYKGRDKIIDGLHRLTKANILGMEKVLVREVPLKTLLRVIGSL
ncbi:hypothetical protein A3A14_00500 [Candidatus Daviesbacteria bacterium RIFCSPLOWO2_01_FULL_43_38]|uniref:ParB/Sulfiredoxin domain-containing protein n=1 Tax=Candidatus Daviesbacteria bacterium RIFCSPHIGHO2_12_FULL_43_11 TaxID=1797780 RepID=A0A1F5K2H1_9BACT|nr:MAG: hypothetical protein A2874_01550 [Candidatus Daviesbacteria bacterium RIFCSPHIGHO2_01_FULL_43_17]OGE35099.1 MAG: hypothetical protein A3E45_03140 [Candidatus Daviesbacteria bacterium RIFCSPHIGHO2_12_FULL_43_11]OGE63723.1 MAG: hypothetical protein A3A14_00500 [Candidatus Daviesbacteria bacterium RIFCSPLOWO2_01_FULL_43_38]OGE70676.1 MAG: hypothetical protein A3J21_02755 [Candidatus Daviesbacteria bacterium RIFCSPLOWO2_02_FULL_43_11]